MKFTTYAVGLLLIVLSVGCKSTCSRDELRYDYNWGLVIQKLTNKSMTADEGVKGFFTYRGLYVEELVRLRLGCDPWEAMVRIGAIGWPGADVLIRYPAMDHPESEYVLLFFDWTDKWGLRKFYTDSDLKLSGVVLMPREAEGVGSGPFVWPPTLEGEVFDIKAFMP